MSSKERDRIMQRQTPPPPSSRKQLPFTSMKPPFGGGGGGGGGDYHHFATGDAQRLDQEFDESVVVKKRPVSVELFGVPFLTSNWGLSSITGLLFSFSGVVDMGVEILSCDVIPLDLLTFSVPDLCELSIARLKLLDFLEHFIYFAVLAVLLKHD